VCTGNLCQAATCSDGIKNENESDVDCGGACGATCGAGKTCNTSGDCQSGNCVSSVCQTGTVKLKLQLADTKGNHSDDADIRPRFNVVNTGATGITLSQVKIRYWYTIDGVTLPQSPSCVSATVGCANVTMTFLPVSPLRNWANYYLEVGFTGAAGTLAAAATSTVEVRFSPTSGTYDETNDYSYNASTANPEDWVWVTGYNGGALLWGVEPVSVSGSVGIRREVWTNITGSAVSNLTSDSRYPASPTTTEMWSMLETPRAWADQYGERLAGWITPPVTGSYKFWISSDDASELWLSTTNSAANKVKIAYVSTYTNYHEWTKEPNQTSVLISLVAGQQYYIEVLHKDGFNTDHSSVRWQLPDGTIEEPIGSNRLTPLY
jgi:hypothetical protein